MKDKNYFFMIEDRPWAGPNPEITSGPDIDTTEGIAIGSVNDTFNVILEVEPSAPEPLSFQPCDIYTLPDLTLYSLDFIDLLKKIGVDNIEYFDANVVYKPSNNSCDYKVANIVGKVRCVDMEKSGVRLSKSGKLMGFDSIVLDENKCFGQKIFRLAEEEALVIVHKSVKDAIELADIKNILFLSDQEWEPGMI